MLSCSTEQRLLMPFVSFHECGQKADNLTFLKKILVYSLYPLNMTYVFADCGLCLVFSSVISIKCALYPLKFTTHVKTLQ